MVTVLRIISISFLSIYFLNVQLGWESTSIESFMLTPTLWYYLSLRLWEPAFVGAEATFTTVAVWVQLGGLPM